MDVQPQKKEQLRVVPFFVIEYGLYLTAFIIYAPVFCFSEVKIFVLGNKAKLGTALPKVNALAQSTN